MKRSWDAAKAKQGEMDRALEGLVRMVGETMGNKLPDKKKVIVAIGLGEFETKNSRHIGFTRVSFAPEKAHGQEESRDSLGGLKTRDKFTEFLCVIGTVIVSVILKLTSYGTK
ncbi:hypothetical protein SeLEV6574_g05544 [Synchytrium endobioticum]|uniref:Uncharacterized protein n=1 Tax=Synchytrium endobioticum TaxID=286115 RepID=A0A507CU27_9FUNG|nr:hypothetical protein SeLEV6574_g05544 [Synchytrium endobioticum]